MESCLAVEQDLDKALTKFRGLGEHSDEVLAETIAQIENLKKEISEMPPENLLTHEQTLIVRDTVQKCKEAMQRLVQGHRELHASVSRVGKSIDRHFVADFGAVAPRAETFCLEPNRVHMEEAIAHHLYRQGLEEAGDAFADESGITSVERSQPFAELQRTAAALEAGDTGPALKWVTEHAEELEETSLPFMLHRMHFLKLGREQGPGAAVLYAREHLAGFAGRYSRELAVAVCALAWLVPRVPPPPAYLQLLDGAALGTYTSEVFLREACSLLELSPTSNLTSAVRAGARVLPALHDIRSKMSHPHVAAWADELPLGVDLGDAATAYHSVFACPILRQQASDQNPPMRLLCGHVISRDALTKLAQGPKTRHVSDPPIVKRLKCPYCPMEQSPSEARQIYFA